MHREDKEEPGASSDCDASEDNITPSLPSFSGVSKRATHDPYPVEGFGAEGFEAESPDASLPDASLPDASLLGSSEPTPAGEQGSAVMPPIHSGGTGAPAPKDRGGPQGQGDVGNVDQRPDGPGDADMTSDMALTGLEALVPRRKDRRELIRLWRVAEREEQARRVHMVDKHLRRLAAQMVPLRSVVIDVANGPRTTFRHTDGSVVVVEGGGAGTLDRIGTCCRRSGARLESVTRLPRKRYWLRFRGLNGEAFSLVGHVSSALQARPPIG